jgi:hypothetical protein
MTNQIVNQTTAKVKLDYDRCNPREVYTVMRQYFPELSAKDYTPKLVFPFIPAGAEADRWCITLRNVEYNINNPKPKSRKRRRSAGTSPKDFNPAAQVTRLATFDSLMK